MLRAEIIIDKDICDIERLFASEEKEFDNKRAYEVKKEKDRLIFSVSAKDSSALRAALNSITKMLIVYEKTKGVIKGADDE